MRRWLGAALGLSFLAAGWTWTGLAVILAFFLTESWPEYVDPTGRAVFISGCDSGFGHALALQLSSRGYRVFAGCLIPDGSGAKALEDVPGVEVLPLDITDDNSVQRAADRVKTTVPELWALVNNAGISTVGELEWCDMDQARRIFDVNVFGALRLTRALLPLVRRCRGRVVNVSSYTSLMTCPGFVLYCMTKSAVRSFSIGLRMEMRKWGVRVIDVEPWLYRTRIASEEVIFKELEKTRRSVAKELLEEYGEDYWQRFEQATRHFAASGESDVQPVVKTLVEAVTCRRPAPEIRVLSPAWRIKFFLLDLLPVSIRDRSILAFSNLLTAMPRVQSKRG